MTCRLSALRAVLGTLQAGLIGGLLVAFQGTQFPPLGTGVSAGEKAWRLKGAASAQGAGPDLEAAPFAPRRYVAYRAPSRLIVDGKLDDRHGRTPQWTDDFVDIEGTAARAAALPHAGQDAVGRPVFLRRRGNGGNGRVGHADERDSVIFHDNDFEVFIDPDGDTHDYYELEINALHAVGPDAGPPLSRRRPGHQRVGHRRSQAASTSVARSTGPATKTRGGRSRSRCRGGSCAEAAPDHSATRRRTVASQLLARAVAARREERPYVKRSNPKQGAAS